MDKSIPIKHVLLIIICVALAIYLVMPKYEVYVSGGDGTVTYRFNKVTGSFQDQNNEGKWTNSKRLLFGIRRAGTFSARATE